MTIVHKWPFHYDAGGYFRELQPDRYYAFGGSGDISSDDWASPQEGYRELAIKEDDKDIGFKPEDLNDLPYTILSGQEYVDFIMTLEPDGDLTAYGHWSE